MEWLLILTFIALVGGLAESQLTGILSTESDRCSIWEPLNGYPEEDYLKCEVFVMNGLLGLPLINLSFSCVDSKVEFYNVYGESSILDF